MKAVIQRVSSAQVSVDGQEVSCIGRGMLILLGVEAGDGEDEASLMADKAAGLRIFEDEKGKMNRSVADIGGEVLVVSQFTLAANCRKGRRPSFDRAAEPETANTLYEKFCEMCEGHGVPTKRGVFAAHMDVALVNDGPVTIILDSEKLLSPR